MLGKNLAGFSFLITVINMLIFALTALTFLVFIEKEAIREMNSYLFFFMFYGIYWCFTFLALYLVTIFNPELKETFEKDHDERTKNKRA